MSNLPSYKMFIGGDWVAAQSGEWFRLLTPMPVNPGPWLRVDPRLTPTMRWTPHMGRSNRARGQNSRRHSEARCCAAWAT